MTTKDHSQLDVPQLVLEAHERCQEHLSPTPLEYSRYLSEKNEGEIKILSLTEKEIEASIRLCR